MSGRQQRVMVQPIVSLNFVCLTAAECAIYSQNVIFKNLQQVRPRFPKRSSPRILISGLSISTANKGRYLAI